MGKQTLRDLYTACGCCLCQMDFRVGESITLEPKRRVLFPPTVVVERAALCLPSFFMLLSLLLL